ncbi:hypothetical protein [Halorubrum tebenquichense]|uniref:STAS/SEC14 domain-containing protein n=1 Tax=Halorubrum tebenquichense DSM 14210 TaxID=1227485 RepID=M0DMV5_9EURY|nr:hypothetical protein [Halorubrum tebenquichense]ELZ36820.1 hypothetical protein C472_09668 [Halorubrum tebenquichense DSM 14210]
MTSSTDRPTPALQEWDFEQRGRVGIWTLDGWQGWADEELETASEHYRSRASEDDIEATIAVFGDEAKLSQETQEYMASEWSENVNRAGVERVAFVADGITSMAVKSRLDVEAEKEEFDTVEEALGWARS